MYPYFIKQCTPLNHLPLTFFDNFAHYSQTVFIQISLYELLRRCINKHNNSVSYQIQSPTQTIEEILMCQGTKFKHLDNLRRHWDHWAISSHCKVAQTLLARPCAHHTFQEAKAWTELPTAAHWNKYSSRWHEIHPLSFISISTFCNELSLRRPTMFLHWERGKESAAESSSSYFQFVECFLTLFFSPLYSMLKFLEVCNSQFQRLLSSAHCNSYQKKKRKKKKRSWQHSGLKTTKFPQVFWSDFYCLFVFFFPWIMQHMYAMQTNKSNTTQDKEKLKSVV